MLKFSRISDIERRVFFYACGLAFFLPFSKAAGNLFLALAILGTIHRLILKRDDVWKIFREHEKIFLSVGALLLAVFLSALSSADALYGIWRFCDRYFFHALIMAPVIFLRFERRQIITVAEFLLAGVFVSNFSVIVEAARNFSMEYWRFGGTLTPMAQGSLLAMFLPVYALLIIHFKEARLKILFSALAVVGVAASLFNGTRGAWLAIIILIPLVILIYTKNRLKSFGAILLALVVVTGIFFATPTLQSRLETNNVTSQSNSERLLMWGSALQMFKDNPVLGIGYGQYAPAYQTEYISPEAKERQQQHAHNNLIQFLAECGIVGAAAFLWIWIYFSYFSLRGWYREKNLAYLLFFCVLWGLMLHGLTEYNFETSVPSKIFWFALGLCLAYCRRA